MIGPYETNQAPIVLSLHGIRTRGTWQKELNEHLERAGFQHRPLDYGYFSALRLLWPWTRDSRIEWFREEYTKYCTPAPSIIAHSLGSYIVAAAMEKYPEIAFDRIILCGSIVAEGYDWTARSSTKQFAAALNNGGKRDFWSLIAPWVISDAGASSVRGFANTAGGAVEQRLNPKFKHSDFFYKLNYTENWIPFLKGEGVKPLHDANRRPFNWRFAVTVLVLLVLVVVVAWFTVRPSIKWLAAASDAVQAQGTKCESEPLPPSVFPKSVDGLVPTRSRVLRAPAVRPERVHLTIVNDTTSCVYLLLYSCADHYSDSTNWHARWSVIPLDAGSSKPYDSFARPFGCFLAFGLPSNRTEPTYLGFVDAYELARARWTIAWNDDENRLILSPSEDQ